jgi:phosphoglycolate phosphatase
MKHSTLKPLPTSLAQHGAVFFDLDGTFIDTAPDFEYVLNNLRAAHNLPPLPYQDIRNTVSNGARALITLAFDLNEGDDGFETLKNDLLREYARHLAIKSTPFDGIIELIEMLESRNIPWGIITNKPSQFTLPLLKALELDHRAAAIVCPDQVTHAKPHAEPMLLACTHADVNPSECIYVGDHIRDIQAGQAANMYTVACRFGYVGNEVLENWHADSIIDHPRELMMQINTHITSNT